MSSKKVSCFSFFFTKKRLFVLNEEKNFSLIKLIYIHFYSHLSFFLLGDLSAPLLRETLSKREKYADESAKKADWGARRVEFDRE